MKQLLDVIGGKQAILGLGSKVFLVNCSDSKQEASPIRELEIKAVGAEDGTTIQAVSVTESPDGILCAVARSDKSLLIFRSFDDCTPIAFKTAKRISSMMFTTVGDDDQCVLVTADLGGDATAYPIHAENISVTGHILTGHTASMLTWVQVAGDRLYTSDRDEKIRICSFPNTVIIKGFLLGHTQFVSCFDAKDNLCVSVGADRMLRLWKVDTYTELASLRLLQNEKDDQHLPTRVVFVPGSFHAVVSYDETCRLDLVIVKPKSEDTDGYSVELGCSTGCDGNPLALSSWKENSIVVLTTNSFLQVSVQQDAQGKFSLASDGDSSLSHSLKECDGVDQMPSSILERDKHGNLVMMKINLNRLPTELQPWNDAARIEISQESNRRQNKRRRQRRKEQAKKRKN